MDDQMLRTTDGDRDRAAKATFHDGRWVGPWETARCEHGRVYSFRWYISASESSPDVRPITADFEGSDIEYGRAGCRKCHPDDEEA
jgi:hypothetical protein